MEKHASTQGTVRGQNVFEWYEALISAALVLVLVLQWLTSPLSSHMLSMFEYRADENLGQHLDLSDAEYHTEDEEVAAK